MQTFTTGEPKSIISASKHGAASNDTVGKETKYRIAIYNPKTDMVSPTWTITLNGADIFIFCRALGHRIKGTIHSTTGQCHIKYDKSFAERNASVLPKWVVDRWFYEKIGAWVEPFRIVFPYDTLDAPRASLPKEKEIDLFPIDNDSDAAFVRFVIVGLGNL